MAAAGNLLAEYPEVESGKRADRRSWARPSVTRRATGATLIVAKLDRLARNVSFIAALMDSGVDFVDADMPMANRLTVHVRAAVAKHEREQISARTKAALAAAKARGTKLGNPNGARALRGKGNASAVAALRRSADQHAAQVLPIIGELRERGITSLHAIAAELNRREIRTARGGHWHPTTVSNLLSRSA